MTLWTETAPAPDVALLRFDGGERRTMTIAGAAELRDLIGGHVAAAEAGGTPPVLVLELDVLHAELAEVLELAQGRPIGDFLPWIQAIEAIEAYPLPVLAAIPREATAGGCELALACDARVVAPEALLGLLETRLGIIPGVGGTQRLPRLVGAGAAALLVYSGQPVDGREALRIGLADALADDPVAHAVQLAASFAANGAPVLAAAKHALRAAAVLPLAEGLRVEGKGFLSLVGAATPQLEAWLRGAPA